MLPTCKPNFAEAVRTTQKVVQASQVYVNVRLKFKYLA
jgi:hypothetical protein